MDFPNIIALLVTITAIASYINHRFLPFPKTIGLTFITLVLSIAVVMLEFFNVADLGSKAQLLLADVQFDEAFLKGMLSYMLFAGSLHVNVLELAKQKWIITFLATIGVIISTFLVGTMLWLFTKLIGHEIPIIFCYVFGALISPTDPIAVLGILKNSKVPKSLETKIAGESLFNDGVGIVLFIMFLDIALGIKEEVSFINTIVFFLTQAVGGVVFGAVLGYVAQLLLRKVNDYDVAALITLAVVTGGAAVAENIANVSSVLAMVIAGLVIGAACRKGAMSDSNIERLDEFWELIDELLNAVLFVLIGLEFLYIKLNFEITILAIASIVLVLIARMISVSVPIALFSVFSSFSKNAIFVMTWGGLRGGVSIALALSLPAGATRDTIVTITYAVVVFSIMFQGLTIGPVVRKLCKNET